MKKLFVLFAVAALGAVGCDDKKSTGKAGGTNTTLVNTITAKERVTAHATTTIIEEHATVKDTRTVGATVTVKDTKDKGGPAIPDPDKKKNGNKD